MEVSGADIENTIAKVIPVWYLAWIVICLPDRILVAPLSSVLAIASPRISHLVKLGCNTFCIVNNPCLEDRVSVGHG
jgi:hypothetical protein